MKGLLKVLLLMTLTLSVISGMAGYKSPPLVEQKHSPGIMIKEAVAAPSLQIQLHVASFTRVESYALTENKIQVQVFSPAECMVSKSTDAVVNSQLPKDFRWCYGNHVQIQTNEVVIPEADALPDRQALTV